MFWRRPTPPSDSADYSKLIWDMGRIIAENTELSEKGLIASLVELGHPEKDARRAYVFVPISFGNDVLRNLGVNFPEDEYYFLPAPGKDLQKRSLRAEPSFAAAEIIQDDFKRTLGIDLFLRIANVSSSVCALNKALANGKTADDIRGATMSSPVVWDID